ncbi:hypothetical protein B0H10DRAFT_1957654 [Mycena sp. CBHHK59/15]|nr:hypothetical protein B0H10DRAFT_1957654 [Mycena sp. CBHHK59/15]
MRFTVFNPQAHVSTIPTALAAQKRPERQPGLTATNAASLIPDAIRKRFATGGWKTHISLHYLKDDFCSHNNTVSAKELDDLYTLDGSRGIIAVAKDLPFAAELELTFAEWFQAWGRLRELIDTYVPQELHLWDAHYNRILNKPNKHELWPVWLAYDSEVRRRACTSAIDPSVFHLEIWNDLEAKNMARVALETVHVELGQSSGSPHGSKSQGQSSGSSRYHPYQTPGASSGSKSTRNSFRGNPNRLQITGPGVEAIYRCFVCGPKFCKEL